MYQKVKQIISILCVLCLLGAGFATVSFAGKKHHDRDEVKKHKKVERPDYKKKHKEDKDRHDGDDDDDDDDDKDGSQVVTPPVIEPPVVEPPVVEPPVVEPPVVEPPVVEPPVVTPPVVEPPVVTPPALDGAALYNDNCSMCHGQGKRGASAAKTSSAIQNNTGGMGMLKNLTQEEINAISNY